MGKKILITLAMALVFGVTASLTFVLTRPMWEAKLETEESSDSITISRDETTSAPPETTTEEETPEETDPAALEEWESQVQAMIDGRKAGISDYLSVYEAQSGIVTNASKSLVTVTARHTDKDWFDNEVSSSQSTSGVVVAVTNHEVIILTDSYLLNDSNKVQVKLNGNITAEAYLKGMDSVNGIAVISVRISELDPSLRSLLVPIPLGNALLVTQGQPVIAIGRPLGYDRSLAYGIISYTNPTVPAVDAMIRILQTDIPSSDEARGMLINTSGELIGWLTTKYSANSTDGFLTAISLSDLKPVIEKLSNGKSMATLGIRGQNVTADISEKQGLPMGVYITKCLTDEPAYEAGIQSGDILTTIDGTVIVSMKDVQTCMERLDPGDVVKVTVKRCGNEEYTEFTFDVTLGAR